MKRFYLLLTFLLLPTFSYAVYNYCESNLSVGLPCVVNATPVTVSSYWNCNATASANACITVKSDNARIICTNGGWYGNNIGRGVLVYNDNFTMIGCNISNYEYGLNWAAGHRIALLQNNSIENISIQTLRVFNLSNLRIENNNFRSYIPDADGIILGNAADNTTFINNRIYGFRTAFQIYYKSSLGLTFRHNISNNNFTNFNKTAIELYNISNSFIEYNNIQNTTRTVFTNGEGISVVDGYYCNNCSIKNNTIINSGRHGINFGGFYSNISYNYIQSVNHVGIGLGDETKEITSGGYNLITNNWIYNVTDGAAISTKDQIFNNYSYNFMDNYYLDRSSAGIEFYNDSNLNNNHYISNNVLYNWDDCLVNTIRNVNFTDNTLDNCTSSFYLGAENTGIDYASTKIRNIVMPDLIEMEIRRGSFTDIDYSSSNNAYLYIKNSMHNWYINLSWSGMKNFSIINQTITLNPIGLNYSIFNVTSGQGIPTFQNKASGTLTTGSGQSYVVSISSASGGCDYPYEDMIITESTDLCYGINNIPDTDADGGILINGNNVRLHCEGTEIKGSNILNSIGINSSNFNNITIDNCTIRDYQKYGIMLYNSKNSTISNNRVYGGNISSIYMNVVTSSVALNNYVWCNGTNVVTSGIYMNWGNYNNITSNVIDGFCESGIRWIANTNNGTINYNNISNLDVGIRWQGSTYGNIKNNRFVNITSNYDGYSTGVHVMEDHSYYSSNWRTNYLNISNNVFLEVGSSAIVAQGGNNLFVENNQIEMIPISQRNKYYADDWGEFPCTFVFSSVHKTFGLNGGSASEAKDHIWNISSNNITIRNNQISNSQCYMLYANVSGLTHDLTNSYYRKIWSFQHKLTPFNYYFPNDITTIKQYSAGNNRIQSTYVASYSIKTRAYMNYWCGQVEDKCWAINYSISNTRMLFATNASAQNLSLFNLTSQYNCVDIFYSNQSSPVRTGCGADYVEWNQTIAAGNRTIVIMYNSTSHPHPIAVAKTISDIYTIYNSTYAIYYISGSGTGQHTHNVSSLIGVDGRYVIYHDNIFYGYGTSNLLTLNGFSNWEIRSEDPVAPTEGDTYRYLGGFFKVTDMLPMLVLTLIIMIVLPIIIIAAAGQTQQVDMQETTGSIIYLVIGVAVIVIMVIVIFAVASNMIRLGF